MSLKDRSTAFPFDHTKRNYTRTTHCAYHTRINEKTFPQRQLYTLEYTLNLQDASTHATNRLLRPR